MLLLLYVLPSLKMKCFKSSFQQEALRTQSSRVRNFSDNLGKSPLQYSQVSQNILGGFRRQKLKEHHYIYTYKIDFTILDILGHISRPEI